MDEVIFTLREMLPDGENVDAEVVLDSPGLSVVPLLVDDETELILVGLVNVADVVAFEVEDGREEKGRELLDEPKVVSGEPVVEDTVRFV